jgi:predicted metal-dependent hydrolase
VRYAPTRSFPPYAFLPGRDPHPTRDPEGHSFEADEESPGYFAPESWRDNPDYLFGVDLYNHGYLWEAHEAWEGLWHAAKPDVNQAAFLQGLIQCAAACLKIKMEQPRGLERLSALGVEKLERVGREEGAQYMGLDPTLFTAEIRAFAASSPESIDGRPTIELDLD